MRIWALLGAHRGDNNQVLALAEALGLPFECKQLSYNLLRHFPPRLLGSTLLSLSRESRSAVSGKPPDVIVAAGLRSVPVVREIKRRSEGKTKLIHVGHPRLSPKHFDVVVATPQYPVAEHPHLLRIPYAMTRVGTDGPPDEAFLAAFPPPRRVLILGGPTLYWRLTANDAGQALDDLFEAARREGGSVLVVGSPRTPKKALDRITARVAKARVPALLVPREGPPSFASLLALGDSFFVTADSVAMVSDAIATGKPVGLIPVKATFGGRLTMGLLDRLRPGRRVHPRDLRFFWNALDDGDLVGTVGNPRRSDGANVNRAVAERVKAILNAENGASR
jgi:mitochondrial fission protein ELM1